MITPLRIGVLNLMHDKLATQRRFTRVLTAGAQPVTVDYFYPRDHYRTRPVPDLVARISKPLDTAKVAAFDGFIVTGAPLETLPFKVIEYQDELHALIDALRVAGVSQLYVCWGAMAAANYLYGIEKRLLPKKYFGVYPNHQLASDPLLSGLAPGFLAPHARYAELDRKQIAETPGLVVTAESQSGHLFSLRGPDERQSFLYAHLEYGRRALFEEYQREVAAHPERTYQKPQNYFTDLAKMTGPTFTWEATQQTYFANWLKEVAANRARRQGQRKG